MHQAPTKEQISKLPVWAQTHLRHTEMERKAALETLRRFTDSQTESNVYWQDHPCLGEKAGSSFIKHYIQTDRMSFVLPRSEMTLDVYVNKEEQYVEITTPEGYCYIKPQCANQFRLIPCEGFGLRPSAHSVLKAVKDAGKLSHDDFVKKHGFSQESIHDIIDKILPKSQWA